MYAQCPQCRTIFSVSPAQLDRAGGRVRCGHCFKPFNAHGHLVDEAGHMVMDELSENPEAPAPGQVLREAAPLTEEGQPAAAPDPGTEVGLQPPPSSVDRATNARSGSVGPEVTTRKSRADAPSSSVRPAEQIPASDEPGEIVVPELLQGELSQLASTSGTSWLVRLAQLSMVVLLLLFLAGQYAWFMPKELLARLPAAQPALAWIYGQLDRSLPVPRDMSRIHLLSRDVRVHPSFGNVLLVNAQLVNKAPYPQPFPTVRLILFGVNGHVIAARGFRPVEYLTSELKLTDGMQPNTPVQVGMELVAPGTAAVSYEFQFL